jgi:hypothetical protein
LRLATSTLADSGHNGSLDPGEQSTLQVPLTNYVTNPLNATTIAGISATLSSATPGVAIVQSGSAYPDLAPGVTGSNATPYRLALSSSFVAGTPVELTLNVTSAEGQIALPFTLQTGTPVYTTLLAESFDAVAPGNLPAGWIAAHGAGVNVVPWITSNAFAPSACGGSNKAFHQEANDVTGGTSFSRWERLISPTIAVPAEAQYVTVDFDVCYDTEDDPILPVLAYDGFFLRIADLTPGRTLRSVLAEAFEEEFTTDGFKHYPKHLPRSSSIRRTSSGSARMCGRDTPAASRSTTSRSEVWWPRHNRRCLWRPHSRWRAIPQPATSWPH